MAFLQLNTLNHAAQGELSASRPFPPAWESMAELEKTANEWITSLRSERSRLAREKGPLTQARNALDRAVLTDELEYLDDPGFSTRRKVSMVRALHLFNQVLLSYHRYVYLLTPLVLETAARFGRPARVLELASGSGELAMACARLAQRKKLPAVFTGSDYIPEYVEQAARKAQAKGLPVDFREVNGFDMGGLADGEFDIIFISQSIHHFEPGQLAMMIAQAEQKATTAFMGFDGYRSLTLLSFLPFLPALTLKRDFVHDAWLTARKLYSQFELETIARIAAPQARPGVFANWPGVSVLQVRFD